MSTHRKNMDRLLRGLMGLCSGITCLVLLMIIGYILYRGIPSLTWNLLSTEPNNLTGNIGILPNILNTLYNNTSSGYAGNDDCGQMSAWYVFSAMGFYPVNPADGRYIIGSPLLDECTLKLAGNKEFRIRTIRKSPEDIYIQSVTLNGKKHKDFFITHQDIMNGGTMVFKMGKKPSGWGK